MIIYTAGRLALPPKTKVENVLLSYHYIKEGGSESLFKKIVKYRRKNEFKEKGHTSKIRKSRSRSDE